MYIFIYYGYFITCKEMFQSCIIQTNKQKKENTKSMKEMVNPAIRFFLPLSIINL